MKTMPPWIVATLVIFGTLLLVPPALVARARFSKSRAPRIHPFPDMDNQLHFKPQSEHPLFADGRAARHAVPGTVARGELRDDDHLYRGRIGDAWATTFPKAEGFELNAEWMARGKERYEVFCSACHGLDGYGNGMVSVRASAVSSSTWVPPTSLHAGGPDGPVNLPVGQLFHTVGYGVRNMAGYASQIQDVRDRWAIVGYVRALQRSQKAN